MIDGFHVAQGSTVYVDSNIFIYQFEDMPGYADRVEAQFAQISRDGGKLVTSELTLAECSYKPAAENNAKLVAAYEEFFERGGEVQLVPLTGEVAKRAAQNGGSWGLKLLDAIHYVSALEGGCNVLLTADRKFKSGPTLRVMHI
jgi:predicted nucleic acid-binding protein